MGKAGGVIMKGKRSTTVILMFLLGFTVNILTIPINSRPYLDADRTSQRNIFSEDFSGVPAGEIPAGWTRTHDNWRVFNSSYAGG